jgi:hypothetical protein
MGTQFTQKADTILGLQLEPVNMTWLQMLHSVCRNVTSQGGQVRHNSTKPVIQVDMVVRNLERFVITSTRVSTLQKFPRQV